MMMTNKIIVFMISVYILPLYSMISLEQHYTYRLFYPSVNEASLLYEKRTNLKNLSCCNAAEVCLIDSSIVVKTLPVKKRIGVCYDYAMRKVLRKEGIDLDLPLVGCQQWVERLSFFKPIINIKKNDLAVYVDSPNNLFSPHFGIVKNCIGAEIDASNIVIKSKWGTIKALFTHSLFSLPIHWGNAVIFFRLKKEYRATGAFKHQLLTSIMYDQSFSLYAQRLLAQKKLELFDLAGQATEYSNRLQFLIIVILEQCPFISIDEQDRFGNTLLIKAVENNNVATARLLCDYGANVTIKNIYGCTPLMIAQWNNNREMFELLQMYNHPQ